MTDKELVKMAMMLRKTTLKTLSEQIGKKSPSSVSSLINAPGASMRSVALFEMLDALDYDIFVVDRKNGETLGRLDFPTAQPRQNDAPQTPATGLQQIEAARERWNEERAEERAAADEAEKARAAWIAELAEAYPTTQDVLSRLKFLIDERNAGRRTQEDIKPEYTALSEVLQIVSQKQK